MAYLNHLYSVPAKQLARCKSWKLIRVVATHATACSHIIGYWPESEPLRNALGTALDGGRVLDPGWRHQLRMPTFHTPDEVSELSAQIEDVWRRALEEFGELAADDWWRIEIEKCLNVFRHAASHEEAVVSILEQSMFVDDDTELIERKPRFKFLRRWFPWLVDHE
ncbi:MAG: hypothetical protein KDA63_11240 [Planctomycetales bacterium]|nr:hypothetical protein [Planctomycetales bacterium]